MGIIERLTTIRTVEPGESSRTCTTCACQHATIEADLSIETLFGTCSTITIDTSFTSIKHNKEIKIRNIFEK